LQNFVVAPYGAPLHRPHKLAQNRYCGPQSHACLTNIYKYFRTHCVRILRPQEAADWQIAVALTHHQRGKMPYFL
jgi:hypothetical protein